MIFVVQEVKLRAGRSCSHPAVGGWVRQRTQGARYHVTPRSLDVMDGRRSDHTFIPQLWVQLRRQLRPKGFEMSTHTLTPHPPKTVLYMSI